MRITSQTTFTAGMLLFLGLVMLALPVGMIYGTSANGPVPGGVWIVAALFAPIGLLVVYFSARQLIQRVRFGKWEVDCPDGGGYLGQPLEVRLLPPQVVHPTGDVECTLVCFHSTGVRSSSQRTGSTRGSAKVFDTSWSLRTATLHPQMGLPISLPLPELGLGSTRGRKATVEWKLSVKIPDGGTTHDMEFEIPINAVGKGPQAAAESIEDEAERRERAAKYQGAMKRY